jgi:cell division protein FtsB
MTMPPKKKPAAPVVRSIDEPIRQSTGLSPAITAAVDEAWFACFGTTRLPHITNVEGITAVQQDAAAIRQEADAIQRDIAAIQAHIAKLENDRHPADEQTYVELGREYRALLTEEAMHAGMALLGSGVEAYLGMFETASLKTLKRMRDDWRGAVRPVVPTPTRVSWLDVEPYKG